MAKINLPNTSDVQRQLGMIPKGSRSHIIRNLLTAFDNLAAEQGVSKALGAVLSGNVRLSIKPRES